MASEPLSPADFDALSPVAKEVAAAMAQIASDVALVIDSQGVIRSVAAGASPLPPDCSRWVGQRWVDTASSDTKRKIELLLEELGQTGVTQRREVNHPIADGDAVPMAWTAIRLGQQGPVVAVGRDLRTVAAIQRRFLDAQHEMELDYWQRRHADSRYRTMFQVARDAVLVLDAVSLAVLECNEAAQALLADAANAGAAPSVMERVPVSTRAPLAELLATARSTGRAVETGLRWVKLGPIWDVSVMPFTVGKRQQLLLRAREQDGAQGDGAPQAMMRALVESTPDAVVITDSAGHILMANPAFVSLVGHQTEAQVKGQSLPLLAGDPDGRWHNTLARTRMQGLCPRTPLSVAHGGLRVAVEVSSTLLADGEQEHLGFTLRTVEPPRPAVRGAQPQAWPLFNALRAQVGLVPLQTLLQEGAEELERQLLRTALGLATGQVEVAARLLAMEEPALRARVQALGLDALGADSGHGQDAGEDEPPPTAPHQMN